MSILIPNMTMPKDCDECPLRWPHLAHCSITGKSTSHYPTGKEIHGKPNYCPLEDAPSIDIVFCEECRDCVEKGTGADCPSGYGYLYCTRKKSVVNEDDYCSWGARR